LITHNRNRADFELVDVPAADPTADPRPVIAEVAGLRIEDVDAFADFIAISYRRGGFARVGIVRLDNESSSPFAAVQELPFGRETGTLLPAGNPEFAQTSIRLLFTSMSTPSVLYSHSVADGTDTVLKRQPVLGSVDAASSVPPVRRPAADDGTQVPLAVVHRAGLHPPAGVDATAAAMAETTAASAQEAPGPGAQSSRRPWPRRPRGGGGRRDD